MLPFVGKIAAEIISALLFNIPKIIRNRSEIKAKDLLLKEFKGAIEHASSADDSKTKGSAKYHMKKFMEAGIDKGLNKIEDKARREFRKLLDG